MTWDNIVFLLSLLLIGNVVLMNNKTLMPPSDVRLTTDVQFQGKWDIFLYKVKIDLADRLSGSGEDLFWALTMESLSLTNTYATVFFKDNSINLRFNSYIVDNGSTTDNSEVTVPDSTTRGTPDESTYYIQFFFLYDPYTPATELYLTIFDEDGVIMLTVSETFGGADLEWQIKLFHHAGSTYDSRNGLTTFSKVQWMHQDTIAPAPGVFMFEREMAGFVDEKRFDIGDTL